MKLWLDDEREPPDSEGWLWVRNVWDAMKMLRSGDVEVISLDYNLGRMHPTGMELLIWMIENKRWPWVGIYVHSRHPVGAIAMQLVIDGYMRGDIEYSKNEDPNEPIGA